MTVALIAALGAMEAHAIALSPVRRCQIAKLDAAGDDLRAKIFCERAALSDTPDPACLAVATGHRTSAFARAETRGVCMAVRDAGAIGTTNNLMALLIGAIAVEPSSPAAARCAARQLALAGRAVSDLVRIATDDARKPDTQRTTRRLDAARSGFAADYARVAALRDCAGANPVAAADLDASVESAVAQLRDLLCPGCGEPRPAPPAEGAVAAIRLRGVGPATSVNTREWVAVGQPDPSGPYEPVGIVLPPDAPSGAGPLPVPGCPLPAVDPACAPQAAALVVGETDWTFGRQQVATATGPGVSVPVAIGPAGEIFPLVEKDDPLRLFDVKPGPGPLFIALGLLDVARPFVWRRPGDAYEMLPAAGFASGPTPSQSDAAGRIVGTGRDPELPVLWLPGTGGYRLDLLPLLPGDTTGGALGIADELIVGWSASATRSRAIVWVLGDEGFAARELPDPDGIVCTRAVATSGGRIAGSCTRDGVPVAIVWLPGDGAAFWSEVRVLAPLEGDEATLVRALSGSLAVGSSVAVFGNEGVERPVAWRLPSAIGRE